jgi:hypothetical protein
MRLVGKYGVLMTQAELEALTRQHLAASFDEIENRLAMDWTVDGLAEITNRPLGDRGGTGEDVDLAEFERGYGNFCQTFLPVAISGYVPTTAHC